MMSTARSQQSPAPIKAAVTAQLAVAIAILTVAPQCASPNLTIKMALMPHHFSVRFRV
jgi:hypothetical protein